MKTILLTLFVCLSLSLSAQRVLTQQERENLINSTEFREKCEWAIRDYASYWNGHDGASLNTAERAKWRREYAILRSIVKAEYQDQNLSLRFVILAKGMSFAVDGDPTTPEIVALFVSGNKFEELASLYFDLITQ